MLTGFLSNDFEKGKQVVIGCIKVIVFYIKCFGKLSNLFTKVSMLVKVIKFVSLSQYNKSAADDIEII